MRAFLDACKMLGDGEIGGVFSYEAGRHKPDSAMYEEFEKRFGIPFLYVDDLQANTDAALSRGWSFKLFNWSRGIMNLLKMRC